MRSVSWASDRLIDRAPLGVAALAVAISAVMAWSAATDYRATLELEESRSRIAETAVSWLATQAETELLRLAVMVDEAQHSAEAETKTGTGMETGTTPATGAVPPQHGADALLPPDIGLQYEIVWSRLDLLRTDSFMTRLDTTAEAERHGRDLDDLAAALLRLDHVLGAAPAPDPAGDAPARATTRRDALQALRGFVLRWVDPIRDMGRALYAAELKLRPEMTRALRSFRETQLRQRLIFAVAALLTGLGSALGLRWGLRLARATLEARTRADETMGAAAHAIAFFDADGRLSRCNAEFADLHRARGEGWRVGDTARDHFARLVAAGLAPDAYRREEAWINHEIAPYRPPSERRLKVLPDGRHLLIECGRRTVGGHLVTVADVTDLVAARDRAEALSAERSEMLAVIGHELRTPISALVGALDLAADLTGGVRRRRAADPIPQDQPPPRASDRLARYVDNARQAAEVIASMSEDVFEFAALSGEVGAGRVADFDLHELFEAAALAAAARAGDEGLGFVAEIGELRGIHVTGDRVRLRQVTENLLANAVKFTETGRVVLRAALDGPPGGPGETRRLRVEVEDTGSGVPPGARKLIFEPFRQLRGAAGRGLAEGMRPEPAGVRGLGLGLAICKRILIGLGGDIGVRPRPGGGSVFWFAAPLRLAEPPAGRARAVGYDPAAAGRGLTVLLVEDDPLLAEVTLAQLARSGFEVDHASAVARAVELGRARRYDLVLLDLQLPDGTGADVARALRAGEGGSRDSLIVALTAYADDGVKADVRGQGIEHILKKPLEADQIAEILRARPDRSGDDRSRDERAGDGGIGDGGSRGGQDDRDPVACPGACPGASPGAFPGDPAAPPAAEAPPRPLTP
ncbi:MAG: ATP-binding protein, partial [Pseudomonadota bacterium]|nr:ATP-binding protein [Pseudomonadota bacterium]